MFSLKTAMFCFVALLGFVVAQDDRPVERTVDVPVIENWKGNGGFAEGNPEAMKGCHWRYIGCYELRKGRIGSLNEMVSELWMADTSPKTCTSLCKQKGFLYSAVGGAGVKELYCYCGNDYNPTELSDGCSEPCPENKMEKCGHFSRMNLYKCLKPEVKPSHPVCVLWNNLGCFNFQHETDSRPVLKGQSYSTKSKGPQGRRECQRLCAKIGAVRSGYTNSGNCLCGAFLQFAPTPATASCNAESQSTTTVQLSSCNEANFRPFLDEDEKDKPY